jgi:hypothetical protein
MKITTIGNGTTLPNGDIPIAQPQEAGHPVHLAASITPQTALERTLLANPRLQAGLDWGAPRFGHPEGRVREHVAAMLAAIPSDDPLRNDLRLLALVDDSFKSEVQPDQPWSAENDHAMLARRFAARYTTDERLLTTLQLHDEPYWIWQNSQAPEKALRPLLKQLPDLELFARFVELDAANEGKDLTFLWWFRRELGIQGQLPKQPASGPDGETADVVYMKTLATTPPQQQAVASAAQELIAEQSPRMQARGEVLTSDDGYASCSCGAGTDRAASYSTATQTSSETHSPPTRSSPTPTQPKRGSSTPPPPRNERDADTNPDRQRRPPLDRTQPINSQ